MTEQEIYRQIWRERKERFTQAEFSKIAGVSRQEISRVERGENSISISKLIKLADILGLKIKIEKNVNI